MYIVGIDIAKRFHEATIIDKAGKVVFKRIRFANSHAGFLKRMEATGHCWLSLYAHLCQAGQTVYVINPLQSDALGNMFLRQTKNDTIDVLSVAEVIRFGRYCETQVALSMFVIKCLPLFSPFFVIINLMLRLHSLNFS